MSDNKKQVYPARGETSADGRFYTHTDGSVHERKTEVVGCRPCSLANLTCHLCNDRETMHPWKQVEGAYVPSDEGREACEMASKMIAVCGSHEELDECRECLMYEEKTCPARAYLAKHGDTNAWEVPT